MPTSVRTVLVDALKLLRLRSSTLSFTQSSMEVGAFALLLVNLAKSPARFGKSICGETERQSKYQPRDHYWSTQTKDESGKVILFLLRSLKARENIEEYARILDESFSRYSHRFSWQSFGANTPLAYATMSHTSHALAD